tara:strand:- start:177 stop:422 length:246 start_codon:yes stop_codon:yes gene_type:complete
MKTTDELLNELIELNGQHVKDLKDRIETLKITIKTQQDTIKIYKDFANASSEYLTNFNKNKYNIEQVSHFCTDEEGNNVII